MDEILTVMYSNPAARSSASTPLIRVTDSTTIVHALPEVRASTIVELEAGMLLDNVTFESIVFHLMELVLKVAKDYMTAQTWLEHRGSSIPHEEQLWLIANHYRARSHVQAAIKAYNDIVRAKPNTLELPKPVVHKTPRKAERGVNGRRRSRKASVQSRKLASEEPAQGGAWNKKAKAIEMNSALETQEGYREVQRSLNDNNYIPMADLGRPVRSCSASLSPRAAFEWRVAEVKARVKSAQEILLRRRAPVPVRPGHLLLPPA